jgi:dTDP-4-dehydrorhamnose reductase
VVVNCAAWTQVDAAEVQPEAAFAVNALGPALLAEGCARCGAALVQISTNEVFAGEPGHTYFEHDLPRPGSVYARSKLAGEAAAAQRLAELYVVRVAWLFGPGGNHFPAKIIAAADRNPALRVVDDEFGNPTYAPDVAEGLVRLVASGRFGVYHLVNSGVASRFDFARAVLQGSGRTQVELTPIPAVAWPRPAPPPAHAVLVNQAGAALGIRLRAWEDALAAYLQVEGARFAR